MAGTRIKDGLEISSDQLKAELIEIKERLGSLETISSLANRDIVESLARRVIQDDVRKKEIMRECQQPKTRQTLMAKFGHSTPQALDHHLNPLRDNDLLHQDADENRIQTFRWSKMFKSLPKANRDSILS